MSLLPVGGSKGTPKKQQPVAVQHAQLMLRTMIKMVPRYKVYLAKADRQLVERILIERTHFSMDGKEVERSYGKPKLVGRIYDLLRDCYRRRVRIFDFRTYALIKGTSHLRKVVMRLMVGKPEVTNYAYCQEIQEALGLEVTEFESEWRLPRKIRDERAAAVLRHVYNRHFDPETKELLPESRKLFGTSSPEMREAVEELEFIFANPELLHKWAPGFPSK